MSTAVSGGAERRTARYPEHETRALLRAHLSAAAGRGHLTRHCPICHRLLRLAMESRGADQADENTPSA
ncbi:DUF6274 family protein [Streptantibioticus ferralitis]|uniref:DUF6274 family protein n=1 Tax=Streptantibioticus ferralitis TaxID=236510 RepID=A0ABT5Z7X0_9ACTN|nr:DUF6274 family protein [Streptantibioticus ferralitis]MDF2259925.1 DUF6274 family protein [Streptantibioticus ferralitis]